MAMLPFCGYNMGDYFRHWLEMGKKMRNPPKIFHVNWFRKDPDGKTVWPGFGENLRVLEWVFNRAEEKVGAVKTSIGFMPDPRDINLEGTGLSIAEFETKLLGIDQKEWLEEAESQNEFFKKLGSSLPEEIKKEQQALLERLQINKGESNGKQ
jgi:phosphoenolpyruvate carboxykinase (GTP)